MPTVETLPADFPPLTRGQIAYRALVATTHSRWLHILTAVAAVAFTADTVFADGRYGAVGLVFGLAFCCIFTYAMNWTGVRIEDDQARKRYALDLADQRRAEENAVIAESDRLKAEAFEKERRFVEHTPEALAILDRRRQEAADLIERMNADRAERIAEFLGTRGA